ncbi:3-phosphoshikimate 1-carboxyvinyltransferase [Algisphaera agarilytica]|uniref:3-phosphoshikimate 1-carboxyvinyltransferase n=1 Tax=Algisphaera agarilytica TaxID=1385975 RepID=A0A7X0H8P8_9BACT|nr:3-phosphoshikimate 1-carboxyvinyltransferase [Algisphaera agarilytica]MBB6431291.1 3-phosphoshikimate 1-carboxyvinyltransferase [Algisphaera agarilytica]
MLESLPISRLDPFDVTLRPPGSKSLTNRALLLAALAKGSSKLTGVLFADDTRRMLEALEALGFQLNIDEPNRAVTIRGKHGTIPSTEAELHLGNAGTAMRFLTAALCLGLGEYTLDGIPRMRQRPIGELVEPLLELGADIEYLGEDGYPPLKIIAEPPGMNGGFLELTPTLSSQFISAMLMIGPYLQRGLEIEFDGPVTSLPYVKMTLNLMKQFGAEFEADTGYRAVHVPTGGYRHYDYPIEPDASNASYFLAAAAVVPGSRCTVEGLGSRSLQGDAEFCDVLGRMGCGVDQKLDSTTITAPVDGQIRGVDVDLNDMPDMAQTLAVVALFGDRPTTIRNVGNLRVKETDRIAALENELIKLGASVTTIEDDITITPPAEGVAAALESLGGAEIDTYDDHRMAMAFSVAGLGASGGEGSQVVINDPSCVEKTFPDYFEFLDRLRGSSD